MGGGAGNTALEGGAIAAIVLGCLVGAAVLAVGCRKLLARRAATGFAKRGGSWEMQDSSSMQPAPRA